MTDLPVNYYPRATLLDFTERYLAALGATAEEAPIVAAGVVAAAARWHAGKGQGLEKLFRLTAQCACGGIVSGTGSNPCVPPGRHRTKRDSPIHPPGQNPNFQIAPAVYSEHVGRCRQVRPANADSV